VKHTKSGKLLVIKIDFSSLFDSVPQKKINGQVYQGCTYIFSLKAFLKTTFHGDKKWKALDDLCD